MAMVLENVSIIGNKKGRVHIGNVIRCPETTLPQLDRLPLGIMVNGLLLDTPSDVSVGNEIITEHGQLFCGISNRPSIPPSPTSTCMDSDTNSTGGETDTFEQFTSQDTDSDRSAGETEANESLTADKVCRLVKVAAVSAEEKLHILGARQEKAPPWNEETLQSLLPIFKDQGDRLLALQITLYHATPNLKNAKQAICKLFLPGTFRKKAKKMLKKWKNMPRKSEENSITKKTKNRNKSLYRPEGKGQSL